MEKGNKDDVWVCDYCDAEFKTKEQAGSHEKKCKKKIIRIKGKVKPMIGIAQGINLGFGFGIGFAIAGAVVFFILGLLGIGFLSALFNGFW